MTSSYKYSLRPDFLQGCFYWKGRGYHYASPAPAALLAPQGWQDSDPWMALATILERAKQGDYSHIAELRKWILDPDSAPTLVSACLGLTADAGLDPDLDFLAELMLEGPPYLRIEACLAAQWSGVLWLIPFMLEAWRSLERSADRQAVEANLSNLLDPLADEPEFYASPLAPSAYAEAVNARLEQLIQKLGSDRIAVLGGAPVDLNQQAWLMRKSLVPQEGDEWLDWSNFLLWRRTFEVYSGVDCCRFYAANGDFQPLDAAAILDRYLAAPQHFEPGRRYFFGKRVE
ncbi:hypothetical protein J4P02_01530 [Pseudomonas sp. NFXW11]|uniref:hypothetical protein n=1 Tax=Pseudomonas sp. NFXW11 TaxID=2819531 RepID=UPI003CEE9516